MNDPAPPRSDELERIAAALEDIAQTLHSLVSPAAAIERAADQLRESAPSLVARVHQLLDQNAGKVGAALRLMKRNTS